jgi:hypothetical protein
VRRIRKLGWPTIVSAALLLAILSGLGMVHARQASDKSRLSDGIVLAEASLDGREQGQTGGQEEMASRLSEISVGLEQARRLLSRTTDSIEASEALFRVATARGVVISRLVISPESSTMLGGLECSMLPLSLSVKGPADEMLDFITALSRDVINGVVTSVNMDVPAELFGLASWAEIDMTIFFYRGDE